MPSNWSFFNNGITERNHDDSENSAQYFLQTFSQKIKIQHSFFSVIKMKYCSSRSHLLFSFSCLISTSSTNYTQRAMVSPPCAAF